MASHRARACSSRLDGLDSGRAISLVRHCVVHTLTLALALASTVVGPGHGGRGQRVVSLRGNVRMRRREFEHNNEETGRATKGTDKEVVDLAVAGQVCLPPPSAVTVRVLCGLPES